MIRCGFTPGAPTKAGIQHRLEIENALASRAIATGITIAAIGTTDFNRQILEARRKNAETRYMVAALVGPKDYWGNISDRSNLSENLPAGISEVQVGALFRLLLQVNSALKSDQSGRIARWASLREDFVIVEDLIEEVAEAGLYIGLAKHFPYRASKDWSTFFHSSIHSTDFIHIMTTVSDDDNSNQLINTEPVIHVASRPSIDDENMTESAFIARNQPKTPERTTSIEMVETQLTRQSLEPASSTPVQRSVSDLSTETATSRSISSSSSMTGEMSQSPRCFRPSYQTLGILQPISPDTARRAKEIGLEINKNYRSGLSSDEVRNAQCLRSLNCSLFVTGIPVQATDKDILDVISEGRVWAFSRNAPETGRSPYCAAKIAFKAYDAAKRFHKKARNGGVSIGGKPVRVIWNRNRVLPQPESKHEQSRVLNIMGPANLISGDLIEAAFHKNIVFDLISREEWLAPWEQKVVEFTFSSIRAQSRAAYRQFMEDTMGTELEGRCTVWYGRDPCEGPTNSASATNSDTMSNSIS